MKTENTPTALRSLQFFLLAVMCAAWPWELYQRVPGAGVTLIKVCGVALIAAVILEMIWRRQWVVPRTHLEIPFAILAIAFLISYATSVDRAATAHMLVTYASYLAFFYAAAAVVRRAEEGTPLAKLVVGSSVLVALLTLACSAGWIAPTYLAMARKTGQIVLSEWRATAPVRMVATSSDLNQGVVPLLISIPLALWLVARTWHPWQRTTARIAVLTLLLAAMVVALSRTSVVVAVLMILAFAVVETRRRRHALMIAGGAVCIALILAVGFHSTLELFGARFEEGLTGKEASTASRLYVYRTAASLIPGHLLAGAGLGASDILIDRVADPELSGNTTLHSVPFKLLLETGLLGLLGYLTLFGAILVRAGKLWRSMSPVEQRLGRAMLVAWAGLFLIMAVQPFVLYSPFALFLALLAGPAAWQTRADTQPVRRTGLLSAAACLGVAACVLPNLVVYQQTAKAVSAYVDHLYQGLQAEEEGRWDAAREHYAFGQTVGNLATRPYATEAEQVAQVSFLLTDLHVDFDHPSVNETTAYLLARVDYSARRFADARAQVQRAVQEAPAFSQAWMLAGDIAWSMGWYAESVDAYHQAAETAAERINAPFAPERTLLVNRIQACVDSEDPRTLLEGARLSIRLGTWESAMDLLDRAARHAPDNAEARYLLGVKAEVAGERDAAVADYEEAVRALPSHVAAQRRLQALVGSGEDRAAVVQEPDARERK